MKAMFAAFAAIVLIALAADYALHNAGFSSAEQFSLKDVRLGL
ncbi:MAG: hypothetical protein AAGD47_08560 [Pseudomonadota bacterium]